MSATTIPAELLLEVFDLTDDEPQPLTWAAVCRHWRRIVLHTGSLWAAVTLHDEQPRRSLLRGQFFAQRAGNRLLAITRHGVDVTHSTEDDRRDICALDSFVETSLPHCRSFTYLEIRKRSIPELMRHVVAVFLTRAVDLETLRLETHCYLDMDVGECERIDMQTSFPRLRTLMLHGVCMPFDSLRWDSSLLERLDVATYCEESLAGWTCQHQHYEFMGGQLQPLLSSCRNLRNVVLRLDLTGARGLIYDFISRFDMMPLLQQGLESLYVQDIGLNWPTMDALRLRPLSFPALTQLKLWGMRTQPAPTAHGIGGYDCSPLDVVFELLMAATNLQRVEFYDWTRPPCRHSPSIHPRPRLFMPRLAYLDFEDCSHNLIRAFQKAIDAPRLEHFAWGGDGIYLSLELLPAELTYPSLPAYPS